MGIFSWIIALAVVLVLIIFFPGLLSTYFKNWRTTIPVTLGLIVGWIFYGLWQRMDPSGYFSRYIWILKPFVLCVSAYFFLQLSRELFTF